MAFGRTCVVGRLMSQQNQYRKYAEEALKSARTATSEDKRGHFFDLAKIWTMAAQQMDEGQTTGPAAKRPRRA